MQMQKNSNVPKGRGAAGNSPNRFSRHQLDTSQGVDDDPDYEEPAPRTRFIFDTPKTIVSVSDSPDIHNFISINPYRGCEHGCIYCYARNSHEYWGFSAGLDFEAKIIVKKNAPYLLEKLFNSKSWVPAVIHLSGNTDCYQPAEKEFRLTRQLLEVCLRYRNPVSILTKNTLVLRDLDLLRELAARNLVSTAVSLTTLNEELRRALEPRTVTGQRRLAVIRTLHEAGVPVGVMTAPIIPGLNDHEIPDLIRKAAANGACWAGFTVVWLNGAIAGLFTDWIHHHFPDRAEKVLHQIRDCHDGNLNDSRFFTRMKGEGNFASNIHQLHQIARKRYLSGRTPPELDTHQFLRKGQMRLF